MSTSDREGGCREEERILRRGKASSLVLDRSVFKRLGNVYVPRGDAPGFCVSTWNTALAGALGVAGAVNDAACRGFEPEAVVTGVLLPAGSGEALLRRVEDGIRTAAAACGVTVAGGHTEVTDAVTRTTVTAFCYGGCVLPAPPVPAPGMEVVACGFAGFAGTLVLWEEKGLRASGRFPLFWDERMEDGKALLCAREAARICAASGGLLQHVGSGGIFAGLWNLSAATGLGFSVDLAAIPIRQETIEVAELWGINPYILLSEGMFLAVVPRGRGEEVCAALREAQRPAAVIGALDAGRRKLVLNRGEERDLERPAADALLNVCGE